MNKQFFLNEQLMGSTDIDFIPTNQKVPNTNCLLSGNINKAQMQRLFEPLFTKQSREAFPPSHHVTLVKQLHCPKGFYPTFGFWVMNRRERNTTSFYSQTLFCDFAEKPKFNYQTLLQSLPPNSSENKYTVGFYCWEQKEPAMPDTDKGFQRLELFSFLLMSTHF